VHKDSHTNRLTEPTAIPSLCGVSRETAEECGRSAIQ